MRLSVAPLFASRFPLPPHPPAHTPLKKTRGKTSQTQNQLPLPVGQAKRSALPPSVRRRGLTPPQCSDLALSDCSDHLSISGGKCRIVNPELTFSWLRARRSCLFQEVRRPTGTIPRPPAHAERGCSKTPKTFGESRIMQPFLPANRGKTASRLPPPLAPADPAFVGFCVLWGSACRDRGASRLISHSCMS